MNLESNKHQFNPDAANSLHSNSYEFGRFRLDRDNRMIYCDGEEMSLTPKQVETLIALIEGRGAIVSKEALMDRLWGESYVEESNLVQNIYVLRKALGKGADGRPMIETLRRRGYRFTQPVNLPNANGRDNGLEAANRPAPFIQVRTAVVAVVGILIVAIGGYFIAAAISKPTTSAEQAPAGEQPLRTKNPEAVALYNHGKNLLRQPLEPVKAAEYLSQALVHDPDFAEAHAWLAFARLTSGMIGTGRPVEEFRKAAESAERALQIEPNSSIALAVRASLAMHADWDLPRAERDLIKAIEMDPKNDHAHGTYAMLLAYRGDTDRAISEMQRAIEIDPADLGYQRDLGRIYYFGRQYHHAITQLKRTLEVNEGFASAFIWLRLSNEMLGNTDEAFNWFIRDQQNLNAERVEPFRSTYRSGGWEAVRRQHYEFLKQDQHRANRHWVAARMAAQLGDTDAAFKYIDAATDNQQWQLITLKADPAFDPIREDARYSKVLGRLRF